MFEIIVSGQFVASHQLHLPDGSLEPLHEHEWHVKVALSGPQLDAAGLLLDFVEVRRWLDALLQNLNGKRLNDLPAWSKQNPSAELVAQHIAHAMQGAASAAARLAWVEVEEEPGCFARFCPEG